jgi:hypothetical protein
MRNLAILARDRSSLVLMLLIAFIVGSVDLIIAPIIGRDPFNTLTGSSGSAFVSTYLVTVYAMMVGSMSQMREFVKESNIYKRERLVNLRIFPYVASKVWVALLLAFYHSLVFVVIHYIAFKVPGDWKDFIFNYITLVLAVMTGMMVGLMASAISNNPAVTPLVLIALVVPMFLLSGGLAPIPVTVNGWDTNRWALQGLSGISGVGSDVASDVCWQLPEDLRHSLTLDDKEYYQCPCMGTQMFEPGSCDFPGLGAYYVPELSQPAPTPPDALPDAPGEPQLPDPPYAPDDPSNQIQVVDYLNSLKRYQDVVQGIQQDYRNQVSFYQNMVAEYQVHLIDYQEALAQYTIARAAAVSAGEGLIEGSATQTEWAWVDKSDPSIYYPWLLRTWIAQLILVIGYFSLILILVKRKDVH